MTSLKLSKRLLHNYGTALIGRTSISTVGFVTEQIRVRSVTRGQPPLSQLTSRNECTLGGHREQPVELCARIVEIVNRLGTSIEVRRRADRDNVHFKVSVRWSREE